MQGGVGFVAKRNDLSCLRVNAYLTGLGAEQRRDHLAVRMQESIF